MLEEFKTFLIENNVLTLYCNGLETSVSSRETELVPQSHWICNAFIWGTIPDINWIELHRDWNRICILCGNNIKVNFVDILNYLRPNSIDNISIF